MSRALAVLALLVAGCAQEAAVEPPAPSEGSSDTVVGIGGGTGVELPHGIHGGTVVAAGDQPVELVVRGDGVVEAYLLGHHAPPSSDVTLSARITTVDGVRAVALPWDPSRTRFRGELGAEALAGPAEVTLEHGGARHEASVPRLDLLEVAPEEEAPAARPPARRPSAATSTGPAPAEPAPTPAPAVALPGAETPRAVQPRPIARPAAGAGAQPAGGATPASGTATAAQPAPAETPPAETPPAESAPAENAPAENAPAETGRRVVATQQR